MQTAAILDLSAIPSAQRAAVQALLEEVAALKDITRRQHQLRQPVDFHPELSRFFHREVSHL
ncbi:hypothetical protein CDV52_09565 [Haematobacter missouriensis]|uniref:Uncharacterized protein n=1 Tax=Haematobacter missouriensis TaxID=366616 RepID=A0A212AR36_9RHOB|nr:hypothetical protein [Haematobacter missouriensis]OWJ74371.1 hypothetical protein CDV53_13800 [Haematobacter missouriensis]OWJ83980.1 hypothetical protein CDV52_09565 [Haematobacter missouriensis]